MQLMAICEGFEGLRDVLTGDKLLLEMIDATCIERNLLPRFHGSRINQNAVSGKNMEKDPPSYMIFEEIAGSDLAWQIMNAAIDLALATPVSLESFRTNLASEDQAGGRKLAKHRARDIYLDIYWNLWKRTATLRKAVAKASVRKVLSPGKSKPNQEKEFWLAVNHTVAELDMSPGQREATADEIIGAFIANDSLPGLPQVQLDRDIRGKIRTPPRPLAMSKRYCFSSSVPPRFWRRDMIRSSWRRS